MGPNEIKFYINNNGTMQISEVISMLNQIPVSILAGNGPNETCDFLIDKINNLNDSYMELYQYGQPDDLSIIN